MAKTGILIPISFVLRNCLIRDELGMTWFMSQVLILCLALSRVAWSCAAAKVISSFCQPLNSSRELSERELEPVPVSNIV